MEIILKGKPWKIGRTWVVTIPNWSITQGYIDVKKEVMLDQ